jgi:hypothetical protein
MKSVELALRILAQPEVSREEMHQRVKAYLKSLSPAELQRLREEDDDGEEWANRIEMLEQLGFVDKEIEAYSRCRFTTPGVRKVIARRALLSKITHLSPEALRAKPYRELCQLEDRLIGEMSTDEMIRRLRL